MDRTRRGGSALRLPNILAHDATWMPDGKASLYAAENRSMVHRQEDGGSTLFATLPGRALWLRWSPDGSLLRFTLLDPLRHTMGLWQIDRSGKNLRKMLDGWNKPSSECCGVWADDGKSFVFQATRGGHTDLWRLDGDTSSMPVQLTNGPLNFGAPASSGHGGRIYFLAWIRNRSYNVTTWRRLILYRQRPSWLMRAEWNTLGIERA